MARERRAPLLPPGRPRYYLPVMASRMVTVGIAIATALAPRPATADAGCSVSDCSVCVLETRTDILPFYEQNGWDIGCDNWDNIVANWCGIDPPGCATVKSDACAVACGMATPDAGSSDQALPSDARHGDLALPSDAHRSDLALPSDAHRSDLALPSDAHRSDQALPPDTGAGDRSLPLPDAASGDLGAASDAGALTDAARARDARTATDSGRAPASLQAETGCACSSNGWRSGLGSCALLALLTGSRRHRRGRDR